MPSFSSSRYLSGSRPCPRCWSGGYLALWRLSNLVLPFTICISSRQARWRFSLLSHSWCKGRVTPWTSHHFIKYGHIWAIKRHRLTKPKIHVFGWWGKMWRDPTQIWRSHKFDTERLQQASPTTTPPGLFIITLLIRPNRWRLQWRQGHLWNSSLCSHKQYQTIYFNLCLVRVQSFPQWQLALVVDVQTERFINVLQPLYNFFLTYHWLYRFRSARTRTRLVFCKYGVEFVHCHYDGWGILCRRHTAVWSSDTSQPLCGPTVCDNTPPSWPLLRVWLQQRGLWLISDPRLSDSYSRATHCVYIQVSIDFYCSRVQ